MENSVYTSYTYLIGWSTLNVWYYGSKYGKNSHHTTFWKTYFTSSKFVKQFRKEHGEPDIIQIRKIFKTPQEAINYEAKVLSRIHYYTKIRKTYHCWLNKRFKQKGFAPKLGKENPYYGKTHTEEIRQRIKEKRATQKFTEETKQKMSISAKNKLPSTEEHLKKISESLMGHGVSEETKNKIREANLKKVCCPHCETTGTIAIMQRWHFNRCKKRGMK